MKRLIPFALLLAGCSPAAQDEPKTTPEVTSKPAATTPTPSATAPKLDNSNRVYQLKDLKKVEMTVKGNPIHAWVMDDDAKTQEGMMFLTDKEVKPDQGMLFAFNQVQSKTYKDGQPRGFWMHNTLIPLDIVFMSDKGKVLNVGNGKVQDDTTVPSAGDFQFVLEMKAGTAARFGLKPGDTIPIPKL